MQKLFLATIVFVLIQVGAQAQQHPLVGTWEMISISGTNVDGEKFSLDSTSIKETKIITPTHYMLIARDRENGKWTFNRCYVGRTTMDDHKYYESPLLSSLRIFENVVTNFDWAIENDTFVQSGTITRPDGKKIILDRFIFQRTKEEAIAAVDSVQGTWGIIDSEKQNGVMIITPTHWMRIIKEGNKLIEASGGTFRPAADGPYLVTAYTSDNSRTSDILLRKQGHKLIAGNYTFEKMQ